MFSVCVDALADKGCLIIIGMMSQYADGWKPSSYPGLTGVCVCGAGVWVDGWGVLGVWGTAEEEGCDTERRQGGKEKGC